MTKVLGFFVFMILWVVGVAAQDVWFNIESSTWLMVYGFCVGTVANYFDLVIKNS